MFFYIYTAKGLTTDPHIAGRNFDTTENIKFPQKFRFFSVVLKEKTHFLAFTFHYSTVLLYVKVEY